MVSRVAKNLIEVPADVDLNVAEQEITVKGKLGELSHRVHSAVKIIYADNSIHFEPANDLLESNALAGTSRALVNNMVLGVSKGFERKLVMVGVGYRAKAQGTVLNLTVGFSHPVNMDMPEGVTVETPSNTEIVLRGANKQRVCQVAANIRRVRPPEPYKGKGIRYHDEQVIRKEAKKK